MTENFKKTTTLLRMLRALEKFDVTDTMLQREHQLNRCSLSAVRKGSDLKTAHNFYFRTLLNMFETMLKQAREDMDDERHHKLKEFMFDIMLDEIKTHY